MRFSRNGSACSRRRATRRALRCAAVKLARSRTLSNKVALDVAPVEPMMSFDFVRFCRFGNHVGAVLEPLSSLESCRTEAHARRGSRVFRRPGPRPHHVTAQNDRHGVRSGRPFSACCPVPRVSRETAAGSRRPPGRPAQPRGLMEHLSVLKGARPQMDGHMRATQGRPT